MDDPNMRAYGELGPTDAEIGRQWREDSSLQKWFPLTAEQLAAKERENLHLAREARTWWEAAQAYAADAERLRAENAALKRDLEYARGGLTKGRTRMREDITRLQAEVEQLHSKNAHLGREAHTWWTAARDATKAERARCALRVALHSQYPIETDYDRGYDKARKDAAETLRTMGDDAGLELGPNVELSGLQRPRRKDEDGTDVASR